MTILEEVKEQVAKERMYESWKEFIASTTCKVEWIVDQVAIRYAEAIKKS